MHALRSNQSRGVGRREFLGLAGAAALAAAARAETGPGSGFDREAYERAVIIDAQGLIGDTDSVAGAELPSAEAIEAARLSGLTAVSMTMGEVGNGPGRFESVVRGVSDVNRLIALHPERFLRILSAADLVRAKREKRLGLILNLQDTAALEGDLARVATLRDRGLRVIQLTYNKRGLGGDGCLESHDGGLSDFGRNLISELERARLLLDLSHGGERTIRDALATSQAPLAITHTGCRALVDTPRNVSDDVLRTVADKGGVVGIYFMPFLRRSGQPHPDDVLAHLDHAVRICGEDHVGIGTDGVIAAIRIDDAYRAHQRDFFETRRKLGIAAPGEAADVFNLVPEYNHPLRFLALGRDLSRRGWPAGRIEKIVGGNFARLFKRVWG